MVRMCMMDDNSEFLQDDTSKTSTICLEKPSHVSSVLCLLLNIIVYTLSPPVPSHTFLADLVPRTTALIRSLFNALYFGQMPLPSAKRAQYMSSVLSSANLLRPVCDFTSFEDTFGDMASRLLLWRLGETSQDCQQAVDDVLLTVFKSPLSVPFVKSNALAVLKSLSSGGVSNDDSLVRAMITNAT